MLFAIAVLLAEPVCAASATRLCGLILKRGEPSETSRPDIHLGLDVPVRADPFDRLLGSRLTGIYGSTFGDSNTPPSTDEYIRRAKAFAADRDSHSVTFFTRDAHGRTTIVKMHLATGEILVSNLEGKIGLYQRLPVAFRPLADFQSSAEISDFLQGRIHAGEDLGPMRFRSAEALENHFRKHVVVLRPRQTYAAWARLPLRASLFPELQRRFRNEVQLSDYPDTKAVEHARAYERQASAFAQSTSPSVISLHGEVPTHRGRTEEMIWKLDLVSREILVGLPRQRAILTYFVLEKSLAISNLQLGDRYRMPPVRTPFEYLLSIAHADTVDK